MIQKNRARTQSRKQDYDYVESHGVGYEKRGGKWQPFNCAFSGYLPCRMKTRRKSSIRKHYKISFNLTISDDPDCSLHKDCNLISPEWHISCIWHRSFLLLAESRSYSPGRLPGLPTSLVSHDLNRAGFFSLCFGGGADVNYCSSSHLKTLCKKPASLNIPEILKGWCRSVARKFQSIVAMNHYGMEIPNGSVLR